MWLLRLGKRSNWLTEKLERLVDAPHAEGDLTPDEQELLPKVVDQMRG